MRDLSKITWALMRDVPDSLNACQHEFQAASWIDVCKARIQLETYRNQLQSLGLTVELIPADEAFPDCCFVEDTAVLIEESAIICRTGAISRRGEVDPIRQSLSDRGFQIVEMHAPAILDGGDVLQIDSNIFAGRSRRTNAAGIELLAQVAKRHDRKVFTVEVRGTLHLKTACTYLGQRAVIGALNNFGDGRSMLEHYRLLPVGAEMDAANVSLVNDQVLVPAHCQQSIQMLIREGFNVMPVNISEFHKAEAGLTCLTILGAN